MKVLLVFLLAVVAANAASLINADAPTRIPGQYLVIVNDDVDIDQYSNGVMQSFDLASSQNNRFLRQYKFNNGLFKGFAAALSDDLLAKFLADPAVKYIEVDQVVSINQGDTCDIQNTPLWNLNRISERALSLKGFYDYEAKAGEGVTNFVVDTGIYVQHQDFGGRASWGWMMDNSPVDGNGHGTHVAGTIGGTQYGVAKKTTLVAVKVLASNGSGSWSDVIAGIQYVANDSRRPAVANLSLGGGNTPSVVAAVEAAIAAGVSFAIAAGNSNADACNFSPANAPNCISIGATNSRDARAYFSNWGTCVRIFAPGDTITAPWIGNPTAINTISGTSMAAPHVAGAASLILANQPLLTPAEVRGLLIEVSSKGYVTDPRNTPNNLVFTHHCENM